MKKHLVAIVGRPNVGKSSLFNVLTGTQTSITSSEHGTTRDRIYSDVEWLGNNFTLVDTGGLDFDDTNAFTAHIREQVSIAIELADCIIFLVDGESGITPLDIEIANLLRKSKKRIVLAVNKLDNKIREEGLYDFYKLKIGDPNPISCTHKRGVGDLLDKIIEALPTARVNLVSDDEQFTEEPASNDTSEPTRVAIIGKPNAGKSSIINRLLGENRVMVSDIAGTTRDTIDSPFKFNGENFTLTDTAGIRRKRSVETKTVEHYSILRALAAIRSSDVCVLVVDATEGLTEQDVRLAGYIHEEGKPSVIVINKWDLVEKDSYTINQYNHDLLRDLAFMSYFKPIFISALTGQRIGEIMKAVVQVRNNAQTRITTGKLNQLIGEYVSVNPTRAKIMYATQVSVAPPTFALFVNRAELLPPTYLRYLENNLRKSIDFTGTPIRILLRNKSEDKK